MERVMTKAGVEGWKWEEYGPDAGKRSTRWAHSARGWLHDHEGNALGNYLDYSKSWSRGVNGETVHAVITGVVGGCWFYSVQESKIHIEREALNLSTLLHPTQHAAKGHPEESCGPCQIGNTPQIQADGSLLHYLVRSPAVLDGRPGEQYTVPCTERRKSDGK